MAGVVLSGLIGMCRRYPATLISHFHLFNAQTPRLQGNEKRPEGNIMDYTIAQFIG